MAGRGPLTVRFLGRSWPVLALLATLAVGAAGAGLAVLLGAPLPFLSGAVIATGIAAVAGLRVAGGPLAFPAEVRNWFIPVIGVSIGGTFTPGLFADAAVWWPSLAALLVYVPLVHIAGFLWCRRAGLDRPTAWFASMPGGFVEAIAMGDAAGARMPVLAAIQFLRLIVCIIAIPIAFSIIEGEVVGSAAGVEMPGARHPLSAADIAVLLACGIGGYAIGTRTGLPAGVITAPLLLSGAAHLLGLVEGNPPAWTVQLTQFVVGLSLGIRFTGVGRGELGTALRLSATLVAATIVLAAALGLALGPFVGEPFNAVILAFVPGGLVEMSLVALSLHVSAIYVTAHHVIRILLAVFFGRWGFTRIAGAQ